MTLNDSFYLILKVGPGLYFIIENVLLAGGILKK